MPDMKHNITVRFPGGEQISLEEGLRLEQLLALLPPRPLPALAAEVNGALQELDYPLYTDSQVQWVDYNCSLGWRIYRRSLVMLLHQACRELFPERQLWVSHSLAEGYFCCFRGGIVAREEEVAALEQRMQEYVEQDLPIRREQVSRADAIRYLQERGEKAQAALLQEQEEKDLDLYSLKEQREHFFGPMVNRCGLLQDFGLEAYEEGFLLRLPAREYLGCQNKGQIIPGRLHAILESYGQWSALMGVSTISDLNRIVRSGEEALIQLMLVAETLYDRQLFQATDQILRGLPQVRLVLLAGPSSSGKTTSTERLGIQFRSMGVEPVRISMDDYFVDREKTPLNERGMKDFESLDALDLELFHENMRELLAGREAALPRYDFKSGKSIHNHRTLRLEKEQILLVEGIHALNPRLSESIPREQVWKIFVSALTQLNLDPRCPFSTSDNRLLRRIARDMQFRGIPPMETLNRWEDVRRGEHRNIFPYQEEADLFINSSLIYELPVLRPLVEEALAAIPPEDPCALEAGRLLQLIRCFAPAPAEIVPRDSILQEFIGNSLFHV